MKPREISGFIGEALTKADQLANFFDPIVTRERTKDTNLYILFNVANTISL